MEWSKSGKCPAEHEEARALKEAWELSRKALAPDAMLIAIPNGGARSPVTGARLRAEGVVPGVPDYFFAKPVGGCPGLWIELKKRRGGRVSPEQKAVMEKLTSAGYSCVVAKGWTEAMAAIERYLDPSLGPVE